MSCLFLFLTSRSHLPPCTLHFLRLLPSLPPVTFTSSSTSTSSWTLAIIHHNLCTFYLHYLRRHMTDLPVTALQKVLSGVAQRFDSTKTLTASLISHPLPCQLKGDTALEDHPPPSKSEQSSLSFLGNSLCHQYIKPSIGC